MAKNKLNSKGGLNANSIMGNSTQISGENPTINNYTTNEDMEDYFRSNHI